MQGDFSRRTFDRSKHYSAVLVEQGRLLTDADSEEEHRILAHRAEQAVGDVVGPCGGPAGHAGFGLTAPGGQLTIGPGPYHVAGLLVENERSAAFTAQPHRFDVPALAAGRHAIVLTVWRRLVTALDDPSLREVALGGPTTASREQVVWQVDAVPVAAGWTCDQPLAPVETTTGRLAARAEPTADLTSPCLVPPQAGYTGLENQFYRVEVFTSGTSYDLTAGATVPVTGFVADRPDQVVVSTVAGLAVGDGVEVIRTGGGGGGDVVPGAFAVIAAIDTPGRTLTLSMALPAFGPGDGPALRRLDATFVASRDNGCVVSTVEAIDGAEVVVHDVGPDDVLGFAIGQLVELVDDRIELEGQVRQLNQIVDLDPAERRITLRTPPLPLAPGPTGIDPARHPKLRRWDTSGGIRHRPDGSAWIHLENGNQVRFTAGDYRSGDHWTFPARTATISPDSGTIEWPTVGGVPSEQAPFGVERRRCLLGRVDVGPGGAVTAVEDCRHLFPPLTALRNLLYVGGDGQEGRPAAAVGGFLPLPGRLEVRVVNGGLPQSGAVVRFTAPGGRLDGAGPVAVVVTGPDGGAGVQWAMGAGVGHQVCEAVLLDPSGGPVAHQRVRFHATLDLDLDPGGEATCVAVGPGTGHPSLTAAIEQLLERGERDLCLCLTPGDQGFEGGLFEVPPEARARLRIQGCGRGSRVFLDRAWELRGWASVELADFDLLVRPEGFVAVRDVAQVALSNVHGAGMPLTSALVRVLGSDRLAVHSCRLSARTPASFEGPFRLTSGLGPLEPVWVPDDELALSDLILRAGLEVAGLSFDERRALAVELRQRAGDTGLRLSPGEMAAGSGLADILERRGEAQAVTVGLERLAAAATSTRPGVALEILTAGNDELEGPVGSSVTLADNRIDGIVSFYGLADPDSLVPADLLRRLESRLDQGGPGRILAGGLGDVHLRDNRLTRLALGRAMQERLGSVIGGGERSLTGLYDSFHLTDNVIDGAVSELLARHVVLMGDEFTLDALPFGDGPPGNEVARVAADTATYTANHARATPAAAPPAINDVTRASASAANLEVTVA